MSDQTNAKDPDSGDEGPKKGGKGRLLILGLVVILLIGGGFLGYSMMASDEEVADAAAEMTAAAPEPELTYVEIERLPAAVTDSDGRTMGYVFLDISLELHGSGDQSLVSQQLPRIQDAFLRSISRDGISRPDEPGVIDFEGVSERFKSAANEVLGGEIVQRVLIPRALRSP